MSAAEIAQHLHGRKSGVGYLARCPAHGDKNPSLSLHDSDGKVLVHCHAGCEQRVVVESLKSLGLWSVREHYQRHRIVATYNYTDENDTILYQVVRYEPKDFKQRRPDGAGGWIWTKGPRQVLYRLPEVLEASIVFVAEGEKDVERLRANGFAATTNAGGARSPWLPGYTAALQGRKVILFPDNDPPGRERVLRIARLLVGKVARMSILELEGAKDVSEWFEQGHSELELVNQLETKNAV